MEQLEQKMEQKITDPLKQAQEVIFSCKMTKTNHPTLVFNENPIHQVALHKHLGMYLDCKLNFEEHLKTIINNHFNTITSYWNHFNTMRH